METPSAGNVSPRVDRQRQIVNVAVFSALVFVATFTLRVTIPATGGYFNIGDSMIYVAALLYGPLVGGLAGGIGASLADIVGYPIFAPGTFIIKLIEGAVVGYVGFKIRPRMEAVSSWKALSVLFGTILGLATYYIGVNYMAPFGNALTDQILWALIGFFLGVFIVSMSLRGGIQVSWQTTAIVIGGAEMVAGYFFYEILLASILPGLGIYAIGEIPLNIGQMLVGLAIALPVIKGVQSALPSVSRSS
jgi:uncharacterized membrane protein